MAKTALEGVVTEAEALRRRRGSPHPTPLDPPLLYVRVDCASSRAVLGKRRCQQCTGSSFPPRQLCPAAHWTGVQQHRASSHAPSVHSMLAGFSNVVLPLQLFQAAYSTGRTNFVCTEALGMTRLFAVEMRARDSKHETEPKAQRNPPTDWSRTLLMTVHCGHSSMASREAGATTVVASGS